MTRALTRWDVLKIIGLLLMFVDHTGYFFFENEQWIRGVGRACAPIFLFLAGFAPHYKFDRKLLAFAIILTLCDWWMKGAPNTLNILWSILLIRVLFYWLEKHGQFALKLHEWVIGALALLPSVVAWQYGSLGVLIALCGYVYKHRTHYAAATPERFFYFIIMLYGTSISLLSQFTAFTTLVTAASLMGMCALISWFVKHPTGMVACPAPLAPAFKLCARHTAIIYAAHLIVLILLTGKSL